MLEQSPLLALWLDRSIIVPVVNHRLVGSYPTSVLGLYRVMRDCTVACRHMES